MPHAYSDPDHRVLQYDPHGRTEGVFTIGRFAQQRGRWRINNYGWNSEIDYESVRSPYKPLIAIIGDSYIEAFQVNVEDSIAATLRKLAKGEYDVYSFGVSGAPLSQYLLMSRYVNYHFKPDVIVMNVIHNDFEASIENLVKDPYSLQLTYKNGAFSEVSPRLYEPSTVRRMLGRSAFVRYLALNLRMNFDVRTIITRLSEEKDARRFNANVDVESVQANRHIIEEATFFLVSQLKKENPNTKLVFMIDAPRNDIYSGTVERSDVLWMHDILRSACVQYECRFVDLTGPFTEKFKTDHVKFNSDLDSHWNEVGHRVAAEVLYDNLP
jgi:hypothetical protein